MKILVCGSRHFDDWQLFINTMNDLSEEFDFDNKQPITIIEGGAKGADFCGRLYAKYCGWELEEYPADWKTHGKRAGPIRNARMLAEATPDLVVAFLAKDSRGTADMLRQAEQAKVLTRVVDI